jgi:hypothetical protein
MQNLISVQPYGGNNPVTRYHNTVCHEIFMFQGCKFRKILQVLFPDQDKGVIGIPEMIVDQDVSKFF